MVNHDFCFVILIMKKKNQTIRQNIKSCEEMLFALLRYSHDVK